MEIKTIERVYFRYSYDNFNMKTTFALSTHALEKHLDATNLNASVFYSKGMMYSAIRQCLEKPDVLKRNGKRLESSKTFPYPIGMLSHTDQPSYAIKLIYITTKRTTFVITAYPVY